MGRNVTDNYGTDVKDYGAVGDGSTDDTTAVQKALDAHKHIFLPDGDFKVLAVIARTSGQRIKGPGRLVGGLPGSYVLSIEADQVDVEGVGVENTSGPNASLGVILQDGYQGASFRNCKFSGDGSQGVVCREVFNDVSIEACEFFGDLSFGVLGDSGDGASPKNWRIVGNTFRDIKGDCIALNYPGVTDGDLSGMSDVSITGNLFSSVDYPVPSFNSGFGVSLSGVNQISVTGNTFKDVRLQSIHVEDECRDIVISSNTIAGNQGSRNIDSSIEVIGVTGLTVEDNIISDSLSSGISLSFDTDVLNQTRESVISGNIIRECVGHGLKVSANESMQIVIAGNTISRCKRDGLVLTGDGGEIEVSSNLITECENYGIFESDNFRKVTCVYSDNSCYRNLVLDYFNGTSEVSIGTDRRTSSGVYQGGMIPVLDMGQGCSGTLLVRARSGASTSEILMKVDYETFTGKVQVKKLNETTASSFGPPTLSVAGNVLSVDMVGSNIDVGAWFHGKLLTGKAPDTTLPTVLIENQESDVTVITSPNGTRYLMEVDDLGVLSTSAV